MAAHLLIRDGTPNWWMSASVWVSPGDPLGPAGNPIAGKPAYLKALVENTGDVSANSARVDFYWANPTMQIAVGVASFVGSAFVDVEPGTTQEALCLVPWIPSIVNGGHECILAAVHSAASSSLPDPLPAGFVFDPPAHDEIAQRNLNVLVASRLTAPRSLTVTAPARADKTVRITARIGGALNDGLLAQLGLKGCRPAKDDVTQVGLAREALCGERNKPVDAREIEMHVPRGTSAGVFASIYAEELSDDEYQLVHLLERSGDRILGGISYVVVSSHKGAAS
jgi:hypothetical protein